MGGSAARHAAYLTGEDFTAADAYLFVILGWCGFKGIDLTAMPALRALRERVAQRPALTETLRAEGFK